MSYHGNTIGLNEGSSSFESASTILYPTFSDLSVNLQMELAKSSGYTVRQLIIANIPVCFEACEIELKAIEELTASLRKSNFKASPPSSQKKEDLIIQIGSCGRRFWNNYIYKPIAGPKAIQLGYVFKFEKALDELLRVYINKTTPPVNLAAAQKAWVDTTPNILKVISQNAELARERAEGVRYIPGKRMAPMDPEKLDTVELGESLTFFQRLNQIALHVSPNPEFNIVFAMTQALSVGISSPNFFDGLTSGEVKTEVRSVLNEASKWASLMEGYFYNNPGGSFHRDILLTVLNNDKVSGEWSPSDSIEIPALIDANARAFVKVRKLIDPPLKVVSKPDTKKDSKQDAHSTTENNPKHNTILYPTFGDLSVNRQMELANIPVCSESCDVELKVIEELTASLRMSNFKASPPSSQKYHTHFII